MFSRFFSSKPKKKHVVARLWMTTPADASDDRPVFVLEGDHALALRPLCGPLMVSYAFDLGDAFHSMSKSEQARLGLDDDQLHAQAVSGVEARALPALKVHGVGDGRCHALTCGGEFEATLLLVDKVWDKLGPELGNDDIVAFAPRKDLLFFCRRSSREGLAELQAMRARVESNGDVKLARDFLLRVGNGWTLFESDDTGPA